MGPPVPFPNTAVKRFSADDTEGATLCGKYVTARKLYLSDNLSVAAVVSREQAKKGRYG